MSKVSLSALIILFLLISCGGEKKPSNENSEKSTDEEQVSIPMKKPVLMFFGNSITAGYQLDPDDAFPALIHAKMDSLGYDYQVINAGLSGETSAGGLSRIDWVLNTIPDVFVLELGANDGLRGLDLVESKINLQGIINKVKKVNPDVHLVIAGMEMPPNLGKTYTDSFRKVFRELAEENNATLIPFILEGVGGNPELNLPDGIHPTAEGHKLIARHVWGFLEGILN